MAIDGFLCLHIVLPSIAGFLSPGWDCISMREDNTLSKDLQQIFDQLGNPSVTAGRDGSPSRPLAVLAGAVAPARRP